MDDRVLGDGSPRPRTGLLVVLVLIVVVTTTVTSAHFVYQGF